MLRRLARPSGPEWERLAAHPRRVAGCRDQLRALAESERRALDRFLLASAPGTLRREAGLAQMAFPPGTDWRWRPPVLGAPIDPAGMARPESGQMLGEAACLYHDCNELALALHQVRNRRADDAAPFGLELETYGFTGSYPSLAIPLPTEALAGLCRSHVLRAEVDLDLERVIGVALRLNIGNGPDIDRLQVPLQGLQLDGPNRRVAEFDLAETQIDAARLESAWLDVMLLDPRMCAVVLREMVVSRHPRAEI